MAEIELKTAPADSRFPRYNQTRHCFTRYIEFHRCAAVKGDEAKECGKFAHVVYITSWDDFVHKSVELFRAEPEKTRYVMKYRHCDSKLVLKVTDDKECIKFKTDQAQDARKMEKMNNIFFTLMARGPEVDLAEVSGKEHTEAPPAKKGRGRKQ